MVDGLIGLLTFAAMMTAAIGVGRAMLRRLALSTDDIFEDLFWSASLGLVAIGVALGVLASFGMADVAPLAIGVWLAALWGVSELVCAVAGAAAQKLRFDHPLGAHADHPFSQSAPTAVDARRPNFSNAADRLARLARRFAFWMAATVLLATLAGVVAKSCRETPRDAALEAAQTLLLPLELIGQRRYPDLETSLALWGLQLNGRVAVSIMAWAWGAVFAGSCLLLGREAVGRRWSGVAAACLLISPGVTRSMGDGGESLASAALCLISLLAVTKLLHHVCAPIDPEPREDARPWQWNGWACVAGAALGAVLGIAPDRGLAWSAVLVGVSVWRLRDRPNGWAIGIGHGITVIGAALVVGGPACCGRWFTHTTALETTNADLLRVGPVLALAMPWPILAPLCGRFGLIAMTLLLHAATHLATGRLTGWWPVTAALLAVVMAKLVADVVEATGQMFDRRTARARAASRHAPARPLSAGDRIGLRLSRPVFSAPWRAMAGPALPIGLIVCSIVWLSLNAVGASINQMRDEIFASSAPRNNERARSVGGPLELAEALQALGQSEMIIVSSGDATTPPRQPMAPSDAARPVLGGCFTLYDSMTCDRRAKFVLRREHLPVAEELIESDAESALANGRPRDNPQAAIPISCYRFRVPSGELAQFKLYLIR